MPRPRSVQNLGFTPILHQPQAQQQQLHHHQQQSQQQVPNFQPMLASQHQQLLQHHQQQVQQHQQQQQQYRGDLQVQRSQGVIILSTNKSQTSAPPPPQPQLTSASAHATNLNLAQFQQQIQQQLHQNLQTPAPAHSASSSMFQSQHVPGLFPSQMMPQGYLTGLYNYASMPQLTSAGLVQPVSQTNNNDVYTPNGAGTSTINYEDFMQAPPKPIQPKAKRKSSRKKYEESSAESESSEEYLDDDGDPDWAPQNNNEVQEPEPVYEIPARRTSTGRGGRGRPRGSGGGRGRGGGGRGKGRGRGAQNWQENSSNPTDQTAHFELTRGRQTRRTSQGLGMQPLDSQQHGISIGTLVAQAVESLNDDGSDNYTHSPASRNQKGRQKRPMAALLHRKDNNVWVEKVPLPSGGISLFAYVDTSVKSQISETPVDDSLEEEDQDLIMAYEIMQDQDKQRSFLCEECGHPSKSRVLHNRHLVSHDPKFSFACCVCSQLFASHDKLKPHLRTHHGTGIFVCPDTDCEGIFQERKSLDDHEFACHPDARPFVCRFCFDRFPTIADSQAHEDGHDEDITATCMKCSETYDKKSLLKQHYMDMHEEKQCQYCEEKLENKPKLEEHVNEKHAELLKPPTPPPPSPGMDDGPPSPVGGDDDGEDILVVGEQKRGRKPAKPSLSKSTPKKPDPKKSVRFSETKSPSKPLTSGSRGRPGPKSKSIIDTKKIVFDPDEVITLSSDEDEKDPDPTWKPGKEDRIKHRSFVPSSPSNRPTRRAARKQSDKSDYVIVVENTTETSKDDTSSNQGLTFKVGDNGKLIHVPTASDPVPPDSLPMEEIMDVIKSKNLTKDTTIVIENDQLESIKANKSNNERKSAASLKAYPSTSSSSRNTSRPTPSTSKSTSSSIRPTPSTSRSSTNGTDSRKWVRPPPAEVIEIDDEGLSQIPNKDSSSITTKEKSSDKPKVLVAKKRTGGVYRSNDKPRIVEKDSSSISTISSSNDTPKPKPAGPIAKKRTAGTTSVYKELDLKRSKSEESKKSEIVPHVKQSRKSTHELRTDLSDPLGFDDDDDEPLIVETLVTSVKPRPPTITTTNSLKLAPLRGSLMKSSSKKGKKSGPKSARKQENEDDWNARHKSKPKPASQSTPGVEYEDSPKRSLRIAMKASVTDYNYDENQTDDIPEIGPNDNEFLTPSSVVRGVGGARGKRGRPSNSSRVTSNITPSNSVPLNSKRSTTTSPANSSSGDGQIIMKAFVNGKWQDVVIGTKLNADDSTAEPVPSTSQPNNIVLPNTSRRSTGGNKKSGPSTRGRKKGSGGNRRGKKAAAAAAEDCWSDDRYQYFSGNNNSHNSYPMHESISYDDGYSNDPGQQDYGETDDAVLPFSLSLSEYQYHDMEYQQDSQQPADDQDIPVIGSVYHVPNDTPTTAYQEVYPSQDESSQGIQFQDDGDDQIDEIPIQDPLAMDDGPMPPPAHEPEPEITGDPVMEEEEAEDDDDPLAGPPPPPRPPPPLPKPVDAKSAISNLRSVLSQITFKR